MIALNLPIDIQQTDLIDMEVFKDKISEYAMMLYQYMRKSDSHSRNQTKPKTKVSLMEKFNIPQETIDFVESLSLKGENLIPDNDDGKDACVTVKYCN